MFYTLIGQLGTNKIINTGEHQSALNYPDQLIENLLDRDDHIQITPSVSTIKHSGRTQSFVGLHS